MRRVRYCAAVPPGIIMDKQQLAELQKRLGYKFKKTALLVSALTHSSYANENRKEGLTSNERLEFLGDSILGMTVAELIYMQEKKMPEGQMTKLRSELVCEKNLAALAGTFGLGGCLILGRGEEKGGGRGRPSILADAVEAVIAAIYLDGGFKPVSKLIKKHFFSASEMSEFGTTDYKTALQELVQTKPGQTLSYHMTGESGPDHMKLFTAEVHLNGKIIGKGSGKSKKLAEQSAAKAALAARG